MSTRPIGFYITTKAGCFYVAQWTGQDWLLPGDGRRFTDESFSYIAPKPLRLTDNRLAPQLQELSSLMAEWSDTAGDHHWLAHKAIEELLQYK